MIFNERDKVYYYVEKSEFHVKTLWVATQKPMGYRTKAYGLPNKSLWVVGQKPMGYRAKAYGL